MFEEQEPPKTFLQKLQERAAASRFFTVSLLIHMGIIIIGGSVVLFKQMADPPDFEAAGNGLVGEPDATATPPETPPDVQQDIKNEQPTLSVPSLTAITTTANTPSFSAPSSTASLPSLTATTMTNVVSPAVKVRGVPGVMTGRPGGGGKGMGPANGQKSEAEKAVLKGLQWLVKTQKSDGSWSEEFKPSMTGFALLCFLGHGEIPSSPEFGPTVGKGIAWVLENGEKNQGRMSMGPISQHGSYEHGIVTYALGEYCAMTECKDTRAVELFRQAIKHIVDGQGPDGGWMYNFDKSQSDTSVTGWQIQALKVAHLSGLNLPGVDEALDKAMLNLKRVQAADGGFGYRAPGSKFSLTGIGVLCTYFWKQAKDESVTKGMAYIMAQLKANPVEYKAPNADLYAWYYNTQACLMVSGANGKDWKTWNGMFQDELIRSQAPDGSWPPMANAGHGNLQKDEAKAGPYYRTCLCILMLEVYYRYTAPTGGTILSGGGGSSLDRPGASTPSGLDKLKAPTTPAP
ncbi:MAG: hypothetical protein K8R23_17690 [Chthoniobacter sp.]|nr:hypothetical protein [Chthoniobacter sp.]